MILYGASGHGKVILDILENTGEDDIIVWDDRLGEEFCGYPQTLPDFENPIPGQRIIISIGVNKIRKKVVDKLNNSITFGNAIHPRAIVSPRSRLDVGSVIMGGAVINPDVAIGKHCIINTSASIDHDCILGDFVHVSPNATLSGNVSVGEGTHIGSGASVIQGIKIGKWCTVGAGTVVIATAVGNPARIIKHKKNFDEV
jgi:sugar O-acyltransferase (sialic acid O-acetyltransferase NeuD family)